METVLSFFEHGLALYMMVGGALCGLLFAAILAMLFVTGESRNLMTLGLIILCLAASLDLVGVACGTKRLERTVEAISAAGVALFAAGAIARFVVGILAVFGIGPMARRRKTRR